VRMGRYAMIGGKSKIVQDVLPFFITDGKSAARAWCESVGLEARWVFRRKRGAR
jgi:UDP-N-acetylglucosamine acyltransferase